MSEALTFVNAAVDADQSFQEIDGFGVNINSRYWENRKLLPVMDLLLEDLGANLFRVDIWGKSNWIDPENIGDRSLLNPKEYAKVYGGEIFQRGWGLMRYLNQHGIKPYLTASGDVPRWMLGADGKTLADTESFTEMLVSMIEWAKRRENLDFTLFGPLNETDIGSPEGPTVNPFDFVRIIELLDKKLKQHGLDDIRLVAAEQGGYNDHYVRSLLEASSLASRMGVIGMHMYGNTSSAEMATVVDLIHNQPAFSCHSWLTEYGDLEQTGEREWLVAWLMTHRLMNALEAGFQGALAWDAFDNYHDHDEAWTIYGLIRTGLRTFTPKKRFYASKHFYRFICPSYKRISVQTESTDLRLLAFTNQDRSKITMAGMNSGRVCYLNVRFKGFPETTLSRKVDYYRTSSSENCAHINEIPLFSRSWPYDGLIAHIPEGCIFSLVME